MLMLSPWRSGWGVLIPVLLLLLLCSLAGVDSFAPSQALLVRTTPSRRQPLCATPFGVVVEAEIEPDRMGEFLRMIETNAKESRKEPGCLRFDVLRSQDANNKFYFYELYRSTDDVDFHKKQKHYEAWATFKSSGGTISSVSHTMDGEFIP